MKKNITYLIFVFFVLSLHSNHVIFSASRSSRRLLQRANNAAFISAATLKMKPKEKPVDKKQAEESKEPTREQYNKYYQLLNDLNACVIQSCSPNGSKIPSICFNTISADQKIRNNCAAQLAAIKAVHLRFELDALVDVKTKLLNASKKACDALSGYYSGGTPPNQYTGEFMSFGTCSVKIGYSPEQLNKGESHSVKNVRRVDIGASRVCSMSSFGVSASSMISDGNEKNAINMEIQTNAALLSLGIDAAASFAKAKVAENFIKKNGRCVCISPTIDNMCVTGNSSTERGKEFIRRGEPYASTKEDCEDGRLAKAGYRWVDNFDNAINSAREKYNEAQKALVSECVQRKSGSARFVPQPFVGNIDELSDDIKNNLALEDKLIVSGDKSVVYLTGNGTPTKFGAEDQVIQINGNNERPFQMNDSGERSFTIPSGSVYGLNSGRQLQKIEVANSIDSSMEKEECLCNVEGRDFSHYDLWDNNTLMCYYSDNSYMNIRIVKQGKNFEKGVRVTGGKAPTGYNTELTQNTKYDWQIGAIEQAEGAYSKAMLTQYMTNVAIKTNIRGLHNDVKNLNNDLKNENSMASVSDVNNALNNGSGGSGSFQKLQNTIGNINSLQQMQVDANKKYNAAIANYESAEANVKSAENTISSLEEEKNNINTLANKQNAFSSVLNNKETLQTLVGWSELSAKKEAAIEATKEIRTGFCYIVTKDNKIGQVIAKENEPFKVNYDILHRNKY